MGLFDFFRRKKIANDKNQSVRFNDKNQIFIDELQQLFSEKRYDEIIATIGNRYLNEQPPLEVKKILVLTYYYKKDYEKSLELAQDVARVLDDIGSWFNVLSALMALNKPEQGEEIFNKILKMHKDVKSTDKGEDFIPQLCVPFIRYYYANMLTDIGLFADALLQLKILADIYCNIKITDATFLYIRGIPFFEDYLELLKKVCKGLNLDIIKSDIVKKLLSSIDNDGRNMLKRVLFN